MRTRLAVAVLAVAAAAPTAAAAPSDVRVEGVVGAPDPPQAGGQFELAGRVLFTGGGYSIRCRVFVGGRRYRNVRLVWDGTNARCFFTVPAAARGRRLTVGLVATQGGSRAATTLRYRVR
jgi:hypothetical protein